MNLLIEYFVPKNTDRHNEYLTCLRHNINNQFIKKIHIFIDDDSQLPEDITSDKLEIIHVETRATYQDFFKYANNNLEGEICILANGDIMLDDTLTFLTPSNIDGKFLALSRWDIRSDGSTFHYDLPYSQDTWIFKSPVNIKNCNFTLGTLGCDNRITYLANKSGLIVTNPSKKIVSNHLHLTNFRTGSADPSKTVKGLYIFVDSNDDLNSPSENIVVSPDNVRPMVNIINQKKRVMVRQPQ